MERERNAALVYNPVSGRRRGPAVRDRIVDTLDERGWRIAAHATDAPGAATGMARDLAASGLVEAVFALGGDGTLRETAAGLVGTDVALGPLPGGTTNVFVHSLGLPSDPVRAAGVLADAPRRTLSLGRCDDEPFLMMVSAGLDATIMAEVSGAAKARWGRAAVVAQGVASWRRYPFEPIRAVLGDRSIEAPFVAACNIPHYGGPFVMAPRADLEAAQLELVSHTGSTRASVLAFAVALALGRHHRRPDVASELVRSVRLEGPSSVRLQMDGDALDRLLPVELGVWPERLEVLAPAPRRG